MRAAANCNFQRNHAELGGKPPFVIFADAPNLDEAAKVAAYGIFRNSGQVCIAGSRLLVERSSHDAFVAKLKAVAEGMRVGDPLGLSTETGAVSSESQLSQSLAFFTEAVDQGAQNVTGGARILAETGGYYIAPTVLADVKPSDRVFQDEVFGPVLAVTPFDIEDEAAHLANDSVFGLAGAVWIADLNRAHRKIRKICAGLEHVNTYAAQM